MLFGVIPPFSVFPLSNTLWNALHYVCIKDSTTLVMLFQTRKRIIYKHSVFNRWAYPKYGRIRHMIMMATLPKRSIVQTLYCFFFTTLLHWNVSLSYTQRCFLHFDFITFRSQGLFLISYIFHFFSSLLTFE